MRRFILTGAPGAGKTALLRMLELAGHPVVEEAATDVIALGQALGSPRPWTADGFVDRVLALQRRRLAGSAAAGSPVSFHDRSPVCTLALSRYLGHASTPLLEEEVERARTTYAQDVFLVRNQGFVDPTPARQISFDDSLDFERLHEQTYLELGYRLVDVPAGPLQERARLVEETAGRLTGP